MTDQEGYQEERLSQSLCTSPRQLFWCHVAPYESHVKDAVCSASIKITPRMNILGRVKSSLERFSSPIAVFRSRRHTRDTRLGYANPVLRKTPIKGMPGRRTWAVKQLSPTVSALANRAAFHNKLGLSRGTRQSQFDLARHTRRMA